MNERKQDSKSKHAFSFNRYQNQSPHISFFSNSKTLLGNSNMKVNVCTRNHLFKNKFEQTTEKRFRAEKKKNTIPLQNNQSIINTDEKNQTNNNSVTIGTQT